MRRLERDYSSVYGYSAEDGTRPIGAFKSGEDPRGRPMHLNRVCRTALFECLASSNKGSADSPERRLKYRSNAKGTTGNRVLLIGRIRELALYRAEVLRMHGFQVLTPETPVQAMNLIPNADFDIAVLTYTLPSDVVEELAEEIRQNCPDCPLIAISDSDRIDKKIFPDQVVLAREGPTALIAALRRVTRKH